MVAWLENAIGRARLTQRPAAAAPGRERERRQQREQAAGGGAAQWRRLLLLRAAPRAVGSPFWDWVDREEDQGEIGFDVK
jgi:hypothetical protein